MENKYNFFKSSMDESTLDSTKKECAYLIYYAQNYYSHYQQFKNLERVHRKLANIYSLPAGKKQSEDIKIKVRRGELDIRYRLFLEFYLKLIKIKYNDINIDNEFVEWIYSYRNELPDLIKEFDLEKQQIENISLEKWIEKSCKTILKTYKSNSTKDNINLGMDNIRTAIRLFKRYKSFIKVPEEKSFNEIFSDDYVYMLLGVMKYNEPLLCLYIAPIRGQLCGSRTINNKTWKWCYKKDYRLSLSELESKIQTMQKYDEIFSQFERISKNLNTIIKKIEKPKSAS